MSKDEFPVLTVKPSRNHYIHLVALFIISILWIGLLFILINATINRVIITKNPSDLPIYLLGVFLIAPISIFMIYTNLGRWVLISNEGISYPLIIKWRRRPRFIPFNKIDGYIIQYDIYDKDEITMVSIILKDGKKVKYPAYKSVNICNLLVETLKKQGIKEIQKKPRNIAGSKG